MASKGRVLLTQVPRRGVTASQQHRPLPAINRPYPGLQRVIATVSHAAGGGELDRGPERRSVDSGSRGRRGGEEAGSRGAWSGINRTSGLNRRRGLYFPPVVIAAPVADPLAPFSPAVRAWFEATFEAPTQAQAEGWAAISQGHHTLIHAPDRQRQDPRRVPLDARSPRGDAPPAAHKGAARHGPGALRLAAEGPHLRRRAEPPGPAGRDRASQPRASASRAPTSPSRRGPATRPPRIAATSPAVRPDILITTPESLYLMLDEPGPRHPRAASSTSSSTRSTRSPARSAAPTSP